MKSTWREKAEELVPAVWIAILRGANSQAGAAVKIVIYAIIAFMFVSATWAAWALWGVGFFYDRICAHGTNCEVMGQIGDLFGGVNALFAGLALAGLVFSLEASRRATAKARQWERDKHYAEQVTASFEWAYLALAKGTGEAARPSGSRLAWLSAARHLLRAEKIAAQVNSDAFIALVDEHREYWRTQFYDLCGKEQFTIEFFAGFNHHDRRQTPNIEYRSAMVIERFMNADWNDPIDELDGHEMVEREGWGASKLGRSIERYIIATQPEFLDRHLERFPSGRIAKDREVVAKRLKERANRNPVPEAQ